jgi:integrase/recombinase XerD
MSQLTEAIETYLYVVSSLSEHTQISYRDKLHVFADFCTEHNIDLADISPKFFRDFIQYVSTRTSRQTGEKIRGHTVTSYGRVIKVFLRWVSGYEEYAGCMKATTLRSLAVPKLEQKTKPILTADEIKRLYAACKQEHTKQLATRDTAILSVLLDTGVRATELCSLTLGNVHLEPADSYILVFGKGKKEREMGVGQRVRLDLHRYMRQYRKYARADEPVFLGRIGDPLTRNGLDQLLYRLKGWAGVTTEGGAHLFRHTFATMYLANGGDVYKLSRLMGHTHVSTTEGYVRSLAQRDARRGQSLLDQLF